MTGHSNKRTMTNAYEDIIDLPHHVSRTRSPMSLHDRAAQFAPFAALSGYEDAVRETARLTDSRATLDECEKQLLNDRLCLLAEQPDAAGEVSITYFHPDTRKEGGAYLTIRAAVREVDEYGRTVLMAGGERIPFGNIFAIEFS